MVTTFLVPLGLRIGILLGAVFTIHAGASGRINTLPRHIGRVISSSATSVPGAIVEKVEFYPQTSEKSDTTIMRTGILVRYPDAKATVLLCHGFMCDKFDSGFLRRIFSPRKI